MRNIIIMAGLLFAFGAMFAQYADQNFKPSEHPATTVAQADTGSQTATGRTISLTPDSNGHFRVSARVDGRTMDFIVDTGASVVVLRSGDAARLGVRPMPSDFTSLVRTANGVVKAAPTHLDSIEIDDLRVRDVQAIVLPDEALSQNLLGTSFLSRLHRYEFASGHLVLEQ